MTGVEAGSALRGVKTALAMIAMVAIVLGVLFMAGFVYFTHEVINLSQAEPEPADGIVVLTGGPARIARGVELLGQKKAKRLLISGVHQATTRKQLAAQVADSNKLFECCIDIGHAALNTAGNAVEGAEWVIQHGYKSVIVVTAAYHLPRSLVEFAHHMPNVTLTSYAVVPKAKNLVADGNWGLNTTRLSLLFSEYSKYLLAIGVNFLASKPAAAG